MLEKADIISRHSDQQKINCHEFMIMQFIMIHKFTTKKMQLIDIGEKKCFTK